MVKLSNRLILLSSIGHGILLAMAIVGGVQLFNALRGTPITRETANTIFGITTLFTCTLCGFFRVARFMVKPTAT